MTPGFVMERLLEYRKSKARDADSAPTPTEINYLTLLVLTEISETLKSISFQKPQCSHVWSTVTPNGVSTSSKCIKCGAQLKSYNTLSD